MTVTMIDTAIEPKQPRRLEKKRNTTSFFLGRSDAVKPTRFC